MNHYLCASKWQPRLAAAGTRRIAPSQFQIDLARLLVSLALLGSWAGNLNAQRAVTVRILPLNRWEVHLSWQASSAVPAPGLPLFPGYQAQRSSDLRDWQDVGEFLPGRIRGEPELLQAMDGQPPWPGAFYRLKSVIDLEYAVLMGENLARGELAQASLFGANLFSARLDETDLGAADLRGADLRFATLTNASFNGANLFGARLSRAIGSSVDFSGADLSFADLDSAELLAVNFRGADLRGTIVTATELRYAAFHETRIDHLTVMNRQSRLIWEIVNQGAVDRDLRNTDLSFANVSGVDLHRADFRNANLFAMFALDADLSGANFTGANIDFLDLRQARLDTNTVIAAKGRLVWEIVNVGVAGRELRNAMLNRTILAGGDLTQCNLSGANFTSSFLNGASLEEANLTAAILIDANLTDANLSGANLTRANLRNAVIENTDLTGAVFSQTTMPDGSVRNR